MALSNPTSLVDIQGLERFKQNLDPILATKATKAELEAATLIPVDMQTVTPATIFARNSILAINGIQYKAVRDTGSLPVTLVMQDGAFVTHTIDYNGQECTSYVVADGTVHNDWMVWSDGSVGYSLGVMQQSFNAAMAAHEQTVQEALGTMDETIAGFGDSLSQKASLQQVLAMKVTAASGVQYTVEQLLTALAGLMGDTVVVNG